MLTRSLLTYRYFLSSVPFDPSGLPLPGRFFLFSTGRADRTVGLDVDPEAVPAADPDGCGDLKKIPK